MCACHFGVLGVGVADSDFIVSPLVIMSCMHTLMAIAICEGLFVMCFKVVHIVDCAQAAQMLKNPVV